MDKSVASSQHTSQTRLLRRAIQHMDLSQEPLVRRMRALIYGLLVLAVGLAIGLNLELENQRHLLDAHLDNLYYLGLRARYILTNDALFEYISFNLTDHVGFS
jgi:hypothetical protein